MHQLIRLAAVVALGVNAFENESHAEQPRRLPEKIDFNRDVRPILSDLCFKCHGFDEKARKANRRLDIREGALSELDGIKAIVPGNLAESDVHIRIHSTDKDEAMPPVKSGKKLSEHQKAIIDQWITQGAPYARHWAFEPVQQPAVPKSPIPNAIDAFVLARLAQEGLTPSPEADRHTLVRRVSLDLIGLPPTPEEADAFVKDSSAEAYEKLVDRLLASPHYGERWARRWLDLARYADTNGYEKDRTRSIWPWRDWVIKALNGDMPFDQFTIEQLAGDMLPHATPEQRIATGFHRNTMLNEEGGIDPLEFRFHAMTDRVATTGTTWLGLTVGCAQCHSHKYDPIQHHEYYQLMAFLDNADEPELDLPRPDLAVQREAHEEKIRRLIAELPNRWPIEEASWQITRPQSVVTASGETPKLLDDGSALFAGPSADKESYTFTIDTDAEVVSHLRLEALTDAALPSKGPGRVKHGNFVLNEISVTAAPKSAPASAQPVKLVTARADFSQNGFPVEHSIDGNLATGWAIDSGGKSDNVNRSATFVFEKPITFPGGTRLIVKLEQQHGQQHTLGRVRITPGLPMPAAETQVETARAARFAEWLTRERKRAIVWTPLRPFLAKSNMPLLTVQPDASILASGDITKSDTYELKFADLPPGITAVRLEALPDETLPAHGPGLTYYEGPKGDFFIVDFKLVADGELVKFGKASESYAKNAMGGNPATAALAIDADLQTGWSTSGREGQAHEAVFQLAAPLVSAKELQLAMMFGRHYACSLGRFRVSVTTDPRGAEAREMEDDVAKLLAMPDADLTAAQRERLRTQFLLTAPELAAARSEIDKLRKSSPKPPTSLVLRERPPENPRPTFLRHRGEYLQPAERVEPGIFSFLPQLPAGAKRDRLAFARWLVSPENPLTARVAVNRAWATFFGRGLVKTVEDFGFQGDSPSHPELLDWLASEFVKQGWSMKKLHRLTVTSATYRQSSVIRPELLARDPENRLLARGPRGRLEAEMVRDSALRAAGLLSAKIGGPSVRPPQPQTASDVSYARSKWETSQGEDRYRRGLYTFTQRTDPYAMGTTFDAPTGEACVARREVSNTPLQALTLLNDVVFVEAAQALGKQLAAQPGSIEDRIRMLVYRCLTRPPTGDEMAALSSFYMAQKQRFAAKELDPAQVAGLASEDAAECAAWTAVTRAIFNLDEAITRG